MASRPLIKPGSVPTALWARTLTRDPSDADIADDTYDADTVLSAIGVAADDLTPYLAAWHEALDQPAAAAQILAWLEEHST